MEDRVAALRVVERVRYAHNPVACAVLRSDMTTAKKGKGAAGDTKNSGDKAYAKSSRCWPGFEPVPGKGEHEEGSCKKVPASKNGGKNVDRETARKKQVALGGKRAEQAKGKSPDAAERKTVSKSKKTSASKTAGKKTSAKKAPAKKATTKKAPTKKKAA